MKLFIGVAGGFRLIQRRFQRIAWGFRGAFQEILEQFQGESGYFRGSSVSCSWISKEVQGVFQGGGNPGVFLKVSGGFKSI